jgi:hypothetical protein
MQNHWIKSSLNKARAEQSIYENYDPIVLTWEDEDFSVMPIIRSNYTELQAEWSIYVTKLEMESVNYAEQSFVWQMYETELERM